jgi:hypothetical protein
MTETMIRMQLDALVSAIKSENEKEALHAGVALAGQVLLDFHRIADALERLAAK